MTNKEVLATKLIRFRELQKLSQFEMATDCKISKETLSLYERQEGNPSLKNLEKIAKRMGISLSELFQE